MKLLKKEAIDDVAVVGGLVAVQAIFAGNSVLLSYVMSLGLNPLTLIIFSAFATFLILSPVAVVFERRLWPKKVTVKLIVQLVLISFGGVTLFQTLFLKGIKLTSPAMATAMPNLAPGLIFIIAWIVRLEKVNVRCLYSRIKILGTLLTVVGAVGMSLMHSTSTKEEPQVTISSSKTPTFDPEKIVGCLYLAAAIFVLSSNIVIQAVALGEFPAPISLNAITSLIGVFTTAAVQLFEDRGFYIDWSVVSFKRLVQFSVLAGLITGTCTSFNGWAMKKRGPVLVSMFSPIGTVCTVLLSVFTIGETIKFGSYIGMLLMFGGLYLVLWAKRKEGSPRKDEVEAEFDAEKPLLLS